MAEIRSTYSVKKTEVLHMSHSGKERSVYKKTDEG
jgi:hypothetical protein